MADDILEVVEGTRYQSSDETRIYTITTTNLVSSPENSVTVVVYDESVDEAVTNKVMLSGTHNAEGDVITLKPLSALTKGHSYRVEVKFTVGNNIFERFFRVRCIK